MVIWQKIFVVVFAIFSLVVMAKGVYETSTKKNSYGQTPLLVWMGIFVWADAIIFGVFWFIVSLISYFSHDWILFLLLVSIFWVVRSFGETFFWFNQQFTPIKRYRPELLRGYRFFKDDSIWFIYQIIMQCITVFSILSTIYFTRLWLIRGF